MRFIQLQICVLLVGLWPAGAFAAAKPAPTPAPTCAKDSDPENLCGSGWSTAGNGAACKIDVEKMDATYPCNFSSSTAPSMHHGALCISYGKHQHMVFTSSQGRPFRVRRLIPLDASCPKNPFAQSFDPKAVHFSGSADSGQASSTESSPIGCSYKLEVQFQANDRPGPPDQYDGNKPHECRDPHLAITQ